MLLFYVLDESASEYYFDLFIFSYPLIATGLCSCLECHKRFARIINEIPMVHLWRLIKLRSKMTFAKPTVCSNLGVVLDNSI